MNSEDITVRYNRITHGASGIAVTGRENYARPDYITLYASERTQRIRIEGNWLDSVNVSPYTGGDARLLLVGGVTNGVGDLAIVGNTIVSSAPIAAFIVFTSSPTAPAVERFDVQRNVFTEGNYGAFADGGLIGSPAFTAFAVPYTFTNNTLIGGTHGYAYPATTTLVSAFTLDTAKVLAATAGVRP
jgi:hypothetical protein